MKIMNHGRQMFAVAFGPSSLRFIRVKLSQRWISAPKSRACADVSLTWTRRFCGEKSTFAHTHSIAPHSEQSNKLWIQAFTYIVVHLARLSVGVFGYRILGGRTRLI